MGTAAFRAGTRVNMNGKLYELRCMISEDLWQLEEISTRRIQHVAVTELKEQYTCGTLRFVGAPTPWLDERTDDGRVTLTTVSDDLLERAKVRRQYVLAVLNMPATQTAIGPVVQSLWEKLQQPESVPHASTVLRWKAVYLAHDRNMLALVERTAKKGNRKPRYPDDLITFAQQAIQSTYLTRERKTIQDAVDKAQILVNDENRMRPPAFRLPFPTRRLIKRLIDDIPARDRYAARYGTTAANRQFRGVHGHEPADMPLAKAEIDHTKLDLFVIDDQTLLPLGRPWVTACMDSYSRCIMGIYIGFEHPSCLSVAACLKHAFLPKESLARDCEDAKNTWQAHGVMRELVVDNGTEFHSKSLENACYSLGISITYSPRKTPWFKGKIERFFGTLNNAVAHGHPGTSFSNIFEKDDYDPVKHAVIRLSALRKMIHCWIVDYYHQKPHSALQASPADMWTSGIRQEDILLPDDPKMLDVLLGRPEQRVLSHKGIQLDDLFYNSPDLTALRSRLGHKLDVEVRINDADLGHIIVLAPDNGAMYKVPALTPRYAAGLTRWQHKQMKRYADANLRSEGMPAWLEAKEEICRMVEEELALNKKKSRARAARFQEHQQGFGKALASTRPSQEDAETDTNKLTASSGDTSQAVEAAPAHIEPAITSTERQKFTPRHRDRTRQLNGEAYAVGRKDD